MSTPDNPFLKLIKAGKIRNLQQLRSAYRTLIMKSHPDALGSDRLIDKYLAFSSYYEEAKQTFEDPVTEENEAPKPVSKNHRFAYYQILQKLEQIDKPYSFHRGENLPSIMELKSEAIFHFNNWDPGNQKLYAEADRDYDRLKTEKPSGPYMKNALAINVSPVFHNIIAYHLTGIAFYRKQVKQNLQAVLQRLTEHNCQALRAYIEVLIDDMNDGPAVFGENPRVNRTRLLAQQGPSS
jgi:hypothetical protein